MYPEAQRKQMVERQIAGRGVRCPRVLDAMVRVPRERFVPVDLQELAYGDAPLPIGEGQTISQPYVVARMVELAALRGGERVLEIGTGSSYASAVLAEIAGEVFTIERRPPLAKGARRALRDLGYERVQVRIGDGTLGWPEAAPFDAILVSAGGPELPPALLAQLAVGGRLVIPVGTARAQHLVRVRRVAPSTYEEDDLGPVAFVPLIGEGGWPDDEPAASAGQVSAAEQLRRGAEPFQSPDLAQVDALLQRIGDARVVLFGDATWGTSEFYRMRARVTRELVERRGFDCVAIEADWPDAARIDQYVRGRAPSPAGGIAFASFPAWMWRNRETADFVDWLRDHNRAIPREEDRVGVYGLDLYSGFSSIESALELLAERDPEVARTACQRYSALTPWQSDPAASAHGALSGRYRQCAGAIAARLSEQLDRRMESLRRDRPGFFDAVQGAQRVADSRRYYRLLSLGSCESWNLRDAHLFDTLRTVLAFRGAGSKAVVWAHGLHVADAAATEMGSRGERNLGQLCREHFGKAAYRIGCGTGGGTVAAASQWGAPLQICELGPVHPESYEHLCRESGLARFWLPLRGADPDLERLLGRPRLQRAIGPVYRPENELAAHWFRAALAREFDEYVWFADSRAVSPLEVHELVALPPAHPFSV